MINFNFYSNYEYEYDEYTYISTLLYMNSLKWKISDIIDLNYISIHLKTKFDNNIKLIQIYIDTFLNFVSENKEFFYKTEENAIFINKLNNLFWNNFVWLWFDINKQNKFVVKSIFK